MLAVSAARCAVDDAVADQCPTEEEAAISGVETAGATTDLDMNFDFTVDDIDFGDFFLRLEDGDALPDLEVDPAEIFAEFEAVAAGSGVEVELRDQQVPCAELLAAVEDVGSASPTGGVDNGAFAEAENEKGNCNNQADEDGNMGGDRAIVPDAKSPSSSTTSSSTEVDSRHRSSGKTSHGKKKAKVDWTPDLHRRFVQAVEQLGIDKAVPSRILEIMGINSLTRHNIASHLQMPTTYVVYRGRVPGVYDDWEDCRRQVHRFSGNSYRGYPTRVEVEGRYARYLAGEMRDMRRNRMKTMAFVMMLIVTMFMFYVIVV